MNLQKGKGVTASWPNGFSTHIQVARRVETLKNGFHRKESTTSECTSTTIRRTERRCNASLSLLPGGVADLISTRGRAYRELGLADKSLSPQEWLDMIEQHPRLLAPADHHRRPKGVGRLQTGGVRGEREDLIVLVRDPVHGDIELSAEERGLLECGAVQRLRYIRQLGTAHLVYPGCTHTRFDHSFGTLHTAQKILAALEKKGHKPTKDEARAIRMAALVHDVSHIPFGHTFEDERKVFPRHDTPGRLAKFLLEGELGERLERYGLVGPCSS